jgi:hypothetical protein
MFIIKATGHFKKGFTTVSRLNVFLSKVLLIMTGFDQSATGSILRPELTKFNGCNEFYIAISNSVWHGQPLPP